MGFVRATWVFLATCAVVLPGCAMTSRAEQRESAPPETSPPSLAAFDPAVPQWIDSLGNFPRLLPSFNTPKKRKPRSLEARLGLARIDQLAGRIRQAQQSYQKLARENPRNPLAQAALGAFLASRHRWSAAAAHLGKAVALAPDHERIRNRFAIALARSGQTDRAIAEFTRAVGRAEAHYNVGYLAWQAGHRRLAIGQFRQALAIAPDIRRAEIMLNRLGLSAESSANAEHVGNPFSQGDAVIGASGRHPVDQFSGAIWPVSG